MSILFLPRNNKRKRWKTQGEERVRAYAYASEYKLVIQSSF